MSAICFRATRSGCLCTSPAPQMGAMSTKPSEIWNCRRLRYRRLAPDAFAGRPRLPRATIGRHPTIATRLKPQKSARRIRGPMPHRPSSSASLRAHIPTSNHHLPAPSTMPLVLLTTDYSHAIPDLGVSSPLARGWLSRACHRLARSRAQVRAVP